MADYTIDFVGHNTEKGSDKVWGYFHLRSNPEVKYTFWGKRDSSNGPVLTFKKPPAMTMYDWRRLVEEKRNKGYDESSIDELERLSEGFTDAFEQRFVMTRLCDSFHPNGRST
ncbi:MAG: hypothetical protein EOP83_04045 [Verrucomicrobiaceae bacterium]|nr:MAG: hypothetical protein EOP83_04045 [Verrucomicrobiaceae bacterium]